MNEFRETIKDAAVNFVTRMELDVHLNKIESAIKRLEISEATLAGKASQKSANAALFLSCASIILAVAAILVHFFR